MSSIAKTKPVRQGLKIGS